MKTFETRTVTYDTEVLVERKCDLCGKKAKTGSKWDTDSCYETNETEISICVKQKEGEVYPEGGSGTEYEIDLCPECFKKRLVPWLKEQGATIEEKEWSY